ncbi:interferon-gamma-inducible GTPase 10-like isoform X1 [Hypanus sabinus]|uniref:interferon-gamma-inducible GTPase 10-like isoform X1 n=2 Tax=Hypanus sabinus TaxID=79690 RepID=UPI0028C4E740|nr:interferon-gamma-inducible GTPase 10-like isoform X1 [Hypanus sabinus]
MLPQLPAPYRWWYNVPEPAVLWQKWALILFQLALSSRNKMPALSKYFSDEEVRSLQSMYSKGDVVTVILELKQKAEDLTGVKIDIAVLGDVGSGKSAFINAMRDVQSDDPEAAPTGNGEASKEPTAYYHPSLPDVQLWDLPGLNSFGFELNRYLKQVNFVSYDFYIIVSQARFRECDGELSKRIQEQQKEFYYIRSKIDNDAYSMQMQGVDFSQGQMQIIQDCLKNFQNVGVKPPAIFLISSFNVKEYDFPKLKNTLATDLQRIRLKAFQLLIEKMMWEIQLCSSHRRKVWLWSVISGVLGSIPASGFPLLAAIISTVAGWIHIRRQFSIREQELRRLANKIGQPLAVLLNTRQPRSWFSATVSTLLGALTVGCTSYRFTHNISPWAHFAIGAVSSFAFAFHFLKSSLYHRSQDERTLAKMALQ